jgi:hypothetical protein
MGTLSKRALRLDVVSDHLNNLNDFTPKIKGRDGVDPNLLFGLEAMDGTVKPTIPLFHRTSAGGRIGATSIIMNVILLRVRIAEPLRRILVSLWREMSWNDRWMNSRKNRYGGLKGSSAWVKASLRPELDELTPYVWSASKIAKQQSSKMPKKRYEIHDLPRFGGSAIGND